MATTPTTKKIRPMGDILRAPKTQSPLHYLLQGLQQAQQLGTLIKPCLPKELAAACAVRRVYKNRISIECESAAWANQLRYYVPEILKCLRQRAEYAHIVAIDCKVKIS